MKDGLAALILTFYLGIGLPALSLILAIWKRPRAFALGVLIASSLGWLILGAMCSGLIN